MQLRIFLHYRFFIVCLLLLQATCLHAKVTPTKSETTADNSSAPWARPRELSQFQTLLSHSPFSLATAEESSPLSERYMITGAVNIDGENEIFIFDRTDQSHEILTTKPNAKSMALIEILHQEDPSLLKATIRANGETGVISNIDTSTNAASMQRPGMEPLRTGQRMPNQPMNNGYNQQINSSRNNTPYSSGYPNANLQMNPSNNGQRRIIRRPPISPQQNSQAYPQNNNFRTSPTQ